jgi:hypothetical protein
MNENEEGPGRVPLFIRTTSLRLKEGETIDEVSFA